MNEKQMQNKINALETIVANQVQALLHWQRAVNEYEATIARLRVNAVMTAADERSLCADRLLRFAKTRTELYMASIITYLAETTREGVEP